MKSSKPDLRKSEFHDQTSIKKKLLDDPRAAIRVLAGGMIEDFDISNLNRIAEQLYTLHDQRETLTETRKINSGLIGKARKNGLDFQPLVHNSKELSKHLDNTNNQIEALVDKVITSFRNNASVSISNTTDQVKELHEKASEIGPSQFLPLVTLNNASSVSPLVSSTTDKQRWNEYVVGNKHATHYHQYEWRGIIERNFAKNCWYLVAEQSGGKIVGVAASIHMDSRIFGSFMLSMPFLIYGGPIADDPHTSHILATHISTVADQNNCTHTELRETHPRDDWHETTEKVSMVLELPQTSKALNTKLGSKIRAQIKRASTEQPEFQLGGRELISEFYSVFSRKMRDHGTPVYAINFFEDMAHTFPQSTHVAVVRLSGKPVAAAFLISYRDTLEIPWAASIRKYDRLGMNMFMYHALLDEAIARGFEYFDFGRSTRGEPTWRFKKQWGAQERQLYWHSLSKGIPYNPGPAGASAKFTLAVKLWKKLPLWAANRIGPIIAKQLPW